MSTLDPNRWFITSRGQKLDILFHCPRQPPRAIVLIYPCVGGTTRTYTVPHLTLLERGLAIVEYHPPIHGRSKGHTEMPLARRDLYEYLFSRQLDQLPLILFGHSAGANALLQLNEVLLHVHFAFFVQPVLSFRESLQHMYTNGTQSQLIDALLKYTTSPSQLQAVLMNSAWGDPHFWHAAHLRQHLDSISQGLMIGAFLEDLYVPGYSVAQELARFHNRCTIVASPKDDWYPVSAIANAGDSYGVDVRWIPTASDHFLHGCWSDVWEVFADCTSHLDLT